MTNVNTRIQNFHAKGYADALTDCDNFLNEIRRKFGYLSVTDEISMDRFLAVIAKEMNTFLGGTSYDKEEVNG